MVKEAALAEVDWETARGRGKACSRSCASGSPRSACSRRHRVARGTHAHRQDRACDRHQQHRPRLRRVDFRDQATTRLRDARCSIAEIEQAAACWSWFEPAQGSAVIAIASARCVRHGAKVSFINRVLRLAVSGCGQPHEQRARHGAAPCCRACRVAQGAGQGRAVERGGRARRRTPSAQHEAVAATLVRATARDPAGALAQHHGAYSELRALATALAGATAQARLPA